MQIIHGSEGRDNSSVKIYKDVVIKAPRGKIFDRYGLPLAINTQSYDLYIQKAGLKDEQMNDALLELYEILIKNGDYFINNFSKYFTIAPYGFKGMSNDEILKWQANINTFNIKEENVIYDARNFYKYLRDEYFNIDKTLSRKQIYAIMSMRYEIMINGWKFYTGKPIKLAKDISKHTLASVKERGHLMPGLLTNTNPKRVYVNALNTAHVLGYIGRINQKELQNNPGYASDDLIGKTGIEFYTEDYLRGQDGLRRMEVDQNGRIMTELKGEPAIPGDNVRLTIDLNLQKVAVNSLKKTIKTIVANKNDKNNFGDAKSGAVVALDVNTGEVLAMVSFPSYDPSVFIDTSTSAQKQRLKLITDNEKKPLYNRALQACYAPGSTFKPIVSIAALQEGVLNQNELISCNGHENIGGREFYCLEYVLGLGAHGPLTLERAIATSCNLYFYKLGVETGISNIDKWAKAFGLGELTGIQLPGENSGNRSNREYKYKSKSEEWWIADTAQTSIGQLYNNFTPLQLANYVATIANGGKRMTPHIIKQIISSDNKVVYEAEPEFEETKVKREYLDRVIDGMQQVAQTAEGTADQYFRDFPISVAGKTGTAETGDESDSSSNGLFVCFAPADDPQIAVAVVIENGVWGSNTAPVARDILASYFGLDDKSKNLKTSGVKLLP